MTKPATPMEKQQRAHYTDAYREEALLLAARVGVTTAASDLGLQLSQIYQWRTKAQQRKTVTEREQALADENARIKRQMADMAEDLAIATKAALRSSSNTTRPTASGGCARFSASPTVATMLGANLSMRRLHGDVSRPRRTSV
ncbi:transposase [Halomonas sp.]|uniref:transposase n=1 Tax=Halomonas sp. TaxID=1486246 RepID=UPI000C89ECB4|nr:transposase [Halomonas sp.]MAR72792.1 hypothetical protein [Halomonas sp.]